ncbi:hypothetical protein OSB04_007455 [Centaurea solstitialis]|uniref:Uncharacterized protein n=1 Tax=Centaurea solstitialis TaxID=347529 RepID=A0AA38WQV9_9ASTR|nr:hypothetical protein OSB04_007455 [Centaurea solstitialis]
MSVDDKSVQLFGLEENLYCYLEAKARTFPMSLGFGFNGHRLTLGFMPKMWGYGREPRSHSNRGSGGRGIWMQSWLSKIYCYRILSWSKQQIGSQNGWGRCGRFCILYGCIETNMCSKGIRAK